MTPLATVKVEPLKIGGRHRDREARAQALAKAAVGAVRQFVTDHINEIIQVRQDFWDIRKDKNKLICGVHGFEEYCEGVLHFSASYIRSLIPAGKNPASAIHDGSANRKLPENISNREQRRRDFKAAHPEYAGKTNREVDKAVHQMISSLPKGPLLTELIAAPYSEELRPDKKEEVFYGEATEDYALWVQRREEKGIGVVGAGNRSHGRGLKRLRKKAKGIRVRNSIQAEGSCSYGFIVTLRGLREREVIPLLKFQEDQRWGQKPKLNIESPIQPQPTNPKPRAPKKKENSPAGKVHVDELPAHVRARVIAQIESTKADET